MLKKKTTTNTAVNGYRWHSYGNDLTEAHFEYVVFF